MSEFSNEEIWLIRAKTEEIAVKYPIEYNYGSRCSLWSYGLSDGLVTEELYNMARKYYGRLWNYVGD